MRTLIGITGASGAAFGVDFLQRCPGERFLIVSDWGKAVLRDELNLTVADLSAHAVATFSDHDLAAPFSSGTNRYDAFVIVPCTLTTLGKIAAGIGDTLITRCAAVALKERMRLVLALRETPLSSLALESALRLAQAGAVVAPIMPPFYHRPSTVAEVVSAFTDKLLELVGVDAGPGWRSERLLGD